MISSARNRLLLLGALWGLVLAVLPAVLAFDDRFVLSLFLVAAFACASLSGSVGALVAGRRAATGSTRRGLFAVSSVGALQGLVSGALAAVLALLLMNPYQLTSLLIAGLACAALSGCVVTLAAGRRAAKGAGRSGLLAGVKIGALQGFLGGSVAALLIWTLMAVTISGFTLRNPVELSVLMSPRVFTGSFFVALSAFVYTLVGGVLLSPLFRMLVKRAVRAGRDAAGGKEDLVVR